MKFLVVGAGGQGAPCAAMLSRAILGTSDPAPHQRVLTYQGSITTKGMTFYEKALGKMAEKGDKVDNKSILKLANLVDDELKRKGKAGGESNLVKIGNQVVRLASEPMITKKVEEGFQFGMNALTMAISGGVGGTGIIGTLLARSRKRIKKEVLKNRIKTKVINTDPNMLAKVNDAAEHTEVAGIIT